MTDILQHVEESEPLLGQLIGAINNENFELVKTLLASSTTELDQIKDSNEDTLLHVAVQKKNLQILEYIINLGAIKIDAFNTLGKTPLLMAAIQSGPEVIKLLVGKGANVNLGDAEGNTPLHYAGYYNLYDNCVTLLENGANVNAQNNQGNTVLHVICEVHINLELVALVMSFGADVSLASWDEREMGYTPFELCLTLRKIQFQNFLVDYVFDDTVKVAIRLKALVRAMEYNCELFPLIVENISEVIYDVEDLEHFLDKIICYEPRYLKLFIKHFDYVIKEIIHLDYCLTRGLRIGVEENYTQLREIYSRIIENLYIVLSDSSAPYFIENINKKLNHGFLASLVTIFQIYNLPKEPLNHLILHLLSHGAVLTDGVLDKIYYFFGDTDVFRTLLHMDIKIFHLFPSRGFPRIIYDVNLRNIHEIPILYDSTVFNQMIHYFGGVKIKRLCVSLETSRKLPDVPSLLELARNTARNHIIDHYEITTSSQFYTLLRQLPINNEYKAIIAFQRKLYCVSEDDSC